MKDKEWRVLVGDAEEMLRTLPDHSVHMCVTSPPYYGLRTYGTETWEGGDPGCDHKMSGSSERGKRANPGGHNVGKGGSTINAQDEAKFTYRDVCRKCGAIRIDRQIGLEESPATFVDKLVSVFAEVHRVLRDDGTLWVNIGDSYVTATSARPSGLKAKDIMGMPWRLAFAMQEWGWYLRSDIIWAKRSPMPESVEDRPTNAYEHIFLFSKREHYYYDRDAVREPSKPVRSGGINSNGWHPSSDDPLVRPPVRTTNRDYNPAGRNMWNYWELSDDESSELMQFRYWKALHSSDPKDFWLLSSTGYQGHHYATFPPEVPRRCIAAGTSEYGCCPHCLAPYERVVEATGGTLGASWHPHDDDLKTGMTMAQVTGDGTYRRETKGWRPTCKCQPSPHDDLVPATVLDCFAGVCTTLLQAARMGRSSIGCELNPIYAAAGIQRIERDPHAMNMVLPMFDTLVSPDQGEEAEVSEGAELPTIDF